jgi:DNA-binding winged helix-turn-helix (wHTH) protein/Tol biopolymer transport system component
MQAWTRENFYFDEFELDAPKRRLLRDGEPVRLNPKAFDLLLVLVENSGRLLTKDDLFQLVWPDRVVEESNLSVYMAQIRKALGETAKQPRYITTVSGEGYRFVADVHEGRYETEISERRTFARIVVEEEEDDIQEIASVAPQRVGFGKWPIAVAAGMLAIIAVAVGGYYLIKIPDTAPSTPAQKADIRRLTTSGKVSAIAAANDGRFLVLAQKESDGESLWLRQIETGSQTRISPSQDLGYLGLAVSPDGNYVYASVYLENKSDTPTWRIPILGGVPEELPQVNTSAAVSFSPDGRSIAYTESHRPETHLYVADADGKNARLLIRAQSDVRTLPFEECNPTAWSPDGQTVAVVFHQKTANASPAGVLLVDPKTGSESVLVQPRWSYIDHVTWLDAETLAFTGFEDEFSNKIWTVSRRTGETRQVMDDLQKYRWLASSSGRLLSAQVNAVSTLYAADFADDVATVEPREILRESGNVFYVDTDESNEIFYSSRATGRSEIWRAQQDGSNPVQITSGANVIYGLTVSPTDGSLIFPSQQNGKPRLWTADADGRNLRAVSDDADPLYPETADTGTIVFQDGDYNVASLAPGESKPRHLARGLKPAISKDGRQIAFFMMDKGKWLIRIVAADTGAPVIDLDLPTNVRERRMKWHPSGKFLGLIYDAGERLSLLLLPTDGGPARNIDGLGKGTINTFAWSSDGKKLFYSTVSETQDVVMIGGF